MDRKTLLTQSQLSSIQAYYRLLVSHGIPVDRVILFGSHAKGTPNKWSDLDVCVVSPLFGKRPFDEGVMLAKLAARVDDPIEPHAYNPKDLADKYDPLASEIRKYGIRVI